MTPEGTTIILGGIVGSTLHGIALDDQDDQDEMWIGVPPEEYVLGLEKWESTVSRTKPEGVRSGPGDLDRVTYSLKHYIKLATAGNPSIITLLYAPTDSLVISTTWGVALRLNADLIVSQQALPRYLGYLTSQKLRLLGLRGQKRTKRPELVEAHGYDTKYASHALRLGLQGLELYETGRLQLPMRSGDREQVLSVKKGFCSQTDALRLIEEVERELTRVLDTPIEERSRKTPLRERPDYDRVNRLLARTHLEVWGRL